MNGEINFGKCDIKHFIRLWLAKAVVTDICVAKSKLGKAFKETRNDIAKSFIEGPILGHVGDSNFHAILLIDPNNPTDK